MFLTGNRVTGIRPKKDMVEVEIRSGAGSEVFLTEVLINSAGLFSDEIAKMANPGSSYRMDPVKGESAKFYPISRKELGMNGMNVYPVPFGYLPDGSKLKASFEEFEKRFKEGELTRSLGVHLTPAFDYSDGKHVSGNTVTIGPAYSTPKGREDYSATRDLGYYHEMVRSFFPNIRLGDIILHQAGIRARLSGYYDFVIEKDPAYGNLINLIGIDSPGLTSCLAIAEYTAKLIH
jgi:glycerol-3-phosphate dehydrogenase